MPGDVHRQHSTDRTGEQRGMNMLKAPGDCETVMFRGNHLPLTREVSFARQMTEGENMKAYNKANIPLAKALRKDMTPWERKLWYHFLRNYPVRFQRQKAIGNYIVDFYCAKARLVIELDGGGHYTAEQTQKDALRTRELESMKLTVVRICNLDIDHNFSGVCQFIDLAVKRSLPQSASPTAPSSEGA